MNEIICGIDEVGRGALAGPLVAAAVVVNDNQLIKLARLKLPIRDSKKLTRVQREQVVRALTATGIRCATVVITARQINNRGIQRANREAIRALIKNVEADSYVVDGSIRIGRIKQKTNRVKRLIDADARIPCVMLASIVAKVQRDQIMKMLSNEFPMYHWERNAGYGTKEHLNALKQHGKTKHHRNIFITTALNHLA